MADHFVSQERIRELYNENNFLQRATDGEFNVIVARRTKPTIKAKNMQRGCESQSIHYLDKQTGEKIVELHQYRNPDGSLAASGKPDPKELYLNGDWYFVSKFA